MRHNEFNLAEMLSDSSNGKTSVGKTNGTLIIVVGLIAYIVSLLIHKGPDLSIALYTSTGLIFIGGGLILGKILSPSKIGPIELDNKENTEN